MTHHSPHEAEDDEALQFGDREMVQRGNEGPRSLDFFSHGQKREKKRRDLILPSKGNGSREEFTSSLEDEKQRLDKIRKGEIVFDSLVVEEERHEARRKREAVSPRRGQAGRQRELILSPLAYHSQMWKPATDYREHKRTWEGKWCSKLIMLELSFPTFGLRKLLLVESQQKINQFEFEDKFCLPRILLKY
jgi:hypothetical protein